MLIELVGDLGSTLYVEKVGSTIVFAITSHLSKEDKQHLAELNSISIDYNGFYLPTRKENLFCEVMFSV